jgi:hypothetical protein
MWYWPSRLQHSFALPWAAFRPVLPLPAQVKLGTTFSQLQCRYLGLDYRDTFRQICGLGFDRIRLCAYWNEIEPFPNQFDFTALDWLLEECDRHRIQAVLALGMKAPRWPEFHFPDWISQRHETGAGATPLDQRSPGLGEATFIWLEAVVQHLRHAPALAYWQIENEPFTRLEITGGRFLSPGFIRREVGLIRKLAPQQQILLTGSIALPSANTPEDETALQDCLALADAVGLNVYSKVPLGQTRYYLEPQPAFWQTLQRWQTQIQQAEKAAWIAEAQAEPWEPHQLVATRGRLHPSASPTRTVQLSHQLASLGYETILLWGCEYWYWQRQQGWPDWWKTMQRLIGR